MDPVTLQLIVALAPLALKLLELAGPEVLALLHKLMTLPSDHHAALMDALSDMSRRLQQAANAH